MEEEAWGVCSLLYKEEIVNSGTKTEIPGLDR
jgi:hypothetical protein